ncbi:hypothetical protein THS27_10220 [Thalassospira sp. MCCC 1A01428]|nr:hypothetical protein THS27_10220 [Thalassospira sp. MCCC 1A01428]
MAFAVLKTFVLLPLAICFERLQLRWMLSSQCSIARTGHDVAHNGPETGPDTVPIGEQDGA